MANDDQQPVDPGPCGARIKGGKLCVLPSWHEGDHSATLPQGKPEESPTPAQGALVPRPDGRGALWQGKAENHVPGPGRPANVVRAAARQAYDERLPMLARIADGEVRTRLVGVCSSCGAEDVRKLTEAELRAAVPSVADRIYALRTLAMFSDLKETGLPDDGLLQELGQAVVDVVGGDPWLKIEASWVEILSRRIR